MLENLEMKNLNLLVKSYHTIYLFVFANESLKNKSRCL